MQMSLCSELDTGATGSRRGSDLAVPGELYIWGLCQGACVELSSNWRGHPQKCDKMKDLVPIYNQGLLSGGL